MPSNFLWGAATSAHQVEGNNIHNDWWAWEQTLPAACRSALAADQYHRFKADFALAKSLGHNAHRMSLEWSRIEPAPGAWNERAIEHYRQVLEELKRQSLASLVTLHHFTNPIWFARAGGWLQIGAPSIFGRYVDTIVERLGDLVDHWVTINEPVVWALQSYWQGVWPPARRHDWFAVQRVIRQLARAHRRAYGLIHRRYPSAQVGLAHNVIAFRGPWARLQDWYFNHRFLRVTAGSHDFIGLNYYHSRDNTKPWPGPVSDLDWPIDPAGLTKLLLDFKKYQLPIYITDNGLADADDSRRADFIRDHLRAIEVAQAAGAHVRGYFHWSLIDNFEWAEGFTPRFGLVAVDYNTLARTPRPSAYVYKAIIQQSQKAV